MLLSKMINQHALQAIASYFLTVHAWRVVANSNVLACYYYLEIAKYLLMTILTSHTVIGNTARCRPSGLCGSIVRFQFSFTIESSCAFAGQHMGGLVMWLWEIFRQKILILRKHHFKWHTRDWEEVIMWKRKRNLYIWNEDITCRINFQCSRRSGMGLITCSRKHSGSQFVLWKRSSAFSTLEKKTLLLLLGKRW